MRAVCVLLVVEAARLRRVTPTVPEFKQPEHAVPVVPFPSTLIDTLRHELVTTDKTMKDAQKQVEHLDGSNKILQNLVIVAFRQMSDLRGVLETVSPELESCVDETMPDRVNLTEYNVSLHEVLTNSSNFSSQALRAEMHLLRVYDEQLGMYKRDLETCRLCAPPTLVIALQSGNGTEPSPVLPRLIGELEEINTMFQGFTGAVSAGGASEEVLQGMSAEAMKALFALQREADELQAQVYECGNQTAPFEIHAELGEHLQAFPKVSETMIRRAQAETDARGKEVEAALGEVEECRKACPAAPAA